MTMLPEPMIVFAPDGHTVVDRNATADPDVIAVSDRLGVDRAR
ncbi:hypothetical protein [Polymorphospora rubra]